MTASLMETVVVGQSARMRAIFEFLDVIGNSESTVLITGETGTGKEVTATLIHQSSRRRHHPFVAVSCALFSETLIESELIGHERGAFTGAIKDRPGRFELAESGTIFLDDIDDVPLSMQVKLLRVLQNRTIERLGGTRILPVNVRVIAGSKRDLKQLVAEGKFREDLYYRLSVVPIRVPALRERLQDVRDLAAYFLTEFCTRNNFRRKAIEEDVLQLLERYHWPGNIRELRNTVERMAILSPEDRITMDFVPLEIRTPAASRSSGLHEVRDSAERDRIRHALEQTDWNVAGAARVLGIERTNLHKRMKALGLNRE